jgi:NTP pyrophosphatase (non-canonical NTP hydrolase)
MENEGVYHKAIQRWGSQLQIVCCIEELSELQKELCKAIRGKDWSMSNIAEEMGDVEVMLDQMKILFDVELATDIYKKAKIKRLEERLEKQEDSNV